MTRRPPAGAGPVPSSGTKHYSEAAPPRLYVNARFLCQPRSGTQRFAEELLAALDRRLAQGELPGLDVIALAPQGRHREPAWTRITLRTIGRSRGHVWEQTALFAAARDGWLLNLVSSGALLHKRQIVTFHDAAVFHRRRHFTLGYRMLHRLLRPSLARRAARIITVSAFSRRELAVATGVPEERFAIVPNGADHMLRMRADDGALARRGLESRGYVLFVGNDAPHKNVITALRAFERLGIPGLLFVTVGIGRSAVFGDSELPESAHIRKLEDVGDAELRSLYEHAALLVFPSLYEGFGIPLLEAMTLGCPVVASTADALVETAGGAAILVPPLDVDGFAEAMRAVIGDVPIRDGLIDRGHARAACFSWDASAQALVTLLNDVSARRLA